MARNAILLLLSLLLLSGCISFSYHNLYVSLGCETQLKEESRDVKIRCERKKFIELHYIFK